MPRRARRVVAAFDLRGAASRRCGRRRRRFPRPSLPDVTLARRARPRAPARIALAFLIFAEGVLLARTLAERHRESVDAGRRARALGAANVAAGIVGRIQRRRQRRRARSPPTRRAAQTQGTQVVALGAARRVRAVRSRPLLDALPRVALAAILIVAGVHLLDLAGMRAAATRIERHAFWLAIGVTLGVLVLGVLPGMLIGVALAFAEVLVEVARPRDAVLRRSSRPTPLPRPRRRRSRGTSPPGVSSTGSTRRSCSRTRATWPTGCARSRHRGPAGPPGRARPAGRVGDRRHRARR